jgi:hypothetical protein
VPGSGEEEISPGFVSSGFNPNPLLLFICTTNVQDLLFFDDFLFSREEQEKASAK